MAEQVTKPEMEVETTPEGVRIVKGKVKTMAAEARQAAIEIIKKLRMAISKYRLYPPGSKIVESAFEELLNILNEYFKGEQMLTISEAKGDLLINGKELSVTDAGKATSVDFAFLLANQGIKSFSFKQGIKKEEVAIFVDCLSKPKEHFRDRGGLISYLKEKEISNIVVNETIYVAVVKGDLIIQKASDLLVQAGGKIDAVIRTLEDTAEMLKTVPDRATRDAITSQMAKKMSNFDPALLKELMERSLPTDVRETGIKEEILLAVSSEKIEECFNSIANWYQDIKKKELLPEEMEEEIGKLKLFLDQLLTTGAAKQVPVHAYENLVKTGVLAQIPAGIEGPSMRRAEVAPVAYATSLLEKEEAVAFLDAGIREDLPKVVNLLCLMDRDDLVAKLLGRITENIRSPLKRIRLQATKFLKSLSETINSSGKSKLLEPVEEIFTQQMETESDTLICSEYADCLRDAAMRHLMAGDYEKSAHLVGLFRRLGLPASGVAPEKREVAASHLKEYTEKTVDVLLSDLRSGDGKRQSSASQVILRLGPVVALPLVRVVEETDDVRVRRMAAGVLSRIGEEGRNKLLDELRLDTPVETARRIITVMDELGNGELLERVSNSVIGLDPKVRIEYLRLLHRLDNPQAKSLLVKQLKDPDISVQREAVKFVGESKIKDAVDSLVKLLRAKNEELQQEVCAALGKIEDPQVIPALISLLKKPGLFSFRHSVSEQVRIAAVWALGKFSTPEVEVALKKVAHDKSALLRTVTQQVLQMRKAT